jgi:nucleoside-triphosphatase THEP1
MGYNLGRTGRPSILALVYSDGAAACRMISELGYRLRDTGVAVAGIVAYHATRDGTPRCDMEIEELTSRIILQLADDQTPQASGCRIDPAAMQDAAALISAAFQKCPELLIVNKFGQLEADGGGLAEVITEAVDLGIPVMVGVPERHIARWRELTGGLADEAMIDSPRVQQWLARRGLVPQRVRAGAETVLTSAA